MKNHLLALTLILIPAAALAARAPDRLLEPVVVPAIGLTAKVEGGRVLLNWKRYKRDDFYAYELLKSETDAEPAYVPKQSLYSAHGVGDIDFEDGKISAGTCHYRLVVVTKFGDLWVSPVVTLTVGEADLRRSIPTVADFE